MQKSLVISGVQGSLKPISCCIESEEQIPVRVEEWQNLLTSLQRKCNVFSLTDPADVNELEISYRPTTELSLFLSAGLAVIHAFCCYSENLFDCERFHVRCL